MARHFLKSGQGIVEKGFKCTAVVVYLGVGPVPFAATTAERKITAGSAGFGSAGAFFKKTAADGRGESFFHGHFPDITDFPLVKNVEVAGINGAVTLHHKVAATGTGGSTGTGGKVHQNSQIIFKGTYAHIVSRFPVPVPAVKETA